MKRTIIYICMACAAAAMAGCGKFLDTPPDNRTQIDNLDKVKSLLVSAYPDRTFATITDARCDGFRDFGATSTGSQPSPMYDFTYTAFRWDQYPVSEGGNDGNDKYFTACYRAIAAANQALESMDEMGRGEEFDVSRSEALLCRAYAHFSLLSLYTNMFQAGNETANPGIPYVTEPETTVNKPYSRGTVASTLDMIRTDLTEGLEKAGTKADFAQPKFHFTREAALAFAVRFSLFTRDYPGVISYANQLLLNTTQHDELPFTNDDGSKALVPSPSDPAMLQMRVNLFDWTTAAGTYSSGEELGAAFCDPGNNNQILSGEVVSAIYLSTSANYFTRYALSESDSEKILTANATGLSWIFPQYMVSTSVVSYFCPKFFLDKMDYNPTTGSGIPCSKIGLFRMEEVLLARAEAYAMTGEWDKALDDLNMFTQRRVMNYTQSGASLYKNKIISYYGSALGNQSSFINSLYNSGFFNAASAYDMKTQKALVLTILDFRRSEFIHEGMRWFDILRWNIPVTHTLISGQSSTLQPNDDRRVMQLPQTTSLSGAAPNQWNTPSPW